MFAASLSHQACPVSVLLGGSGRHRIVEQKKPDVAALLKPRADLGVSRSMPADAVVPPWEVDFHDLDHELASAIDIALVMDDPELVLERCEC
jgi:hypothetical protein